MDAGTFDAPVEGAEALNFDDYLSRLQRAGIVPQDCLESSLADADAKLSGLARIEALAGTLQSSGLLTPWQHRILLEGRSEPLMLGRYRLLYELTRGGMARVYLAEHVQMRRRVAIKVFSNLPDIKDVRLQRFLVESRAAASLDHPHVARTFHFDWEGDLYYLVMEFVEGENLDALVERAGPLDAAKAAEYVRQAAEGLAHAHLKGLIHRDVKPANLMLDASGNVKVLDLGLARFTKADEPILTQDQGFLGTVDYVAPEQIVNSHEVDVRADVYGLGGTLYYLLTGQAPYHEYKLFERLHRHLYAAPRDIRQLRPDAPQRLIAICDKMMAKQPGDRYQTAAEAEKALADWLAAQSDSVNEQSITSIAVLARESNERLRSALAALSAGAAHRFNNILQCIEGDLSLACDGLPPDAQLRRRLQPIETIVRSATDLTRQLQICAGKNPSVAVPCRLDEVLTEQEKVLHGVLPERIKLQMQIEPDLPLVLADPAQLRMLCQNLTANARDAIGDRSGVIGLRAGRVEVSGEARVFLEVSDDGCGMHEETRLRAFEPFFSTKSPERGLGLAVVQGIVQSFQGDVSLRTTAGRGTTARVTLRAAPAQIQGHQTPVTKGCILVAEDDTPIRELMGRALRSAGFTVLLAQDGSQALEMYRAHQNQIDLVVLDMWMPGMSGEQLYQELRTIRSHVKAILASGSLDRATVDRLTRLGLSGVIQKPYQPFALVEKILDLLPSR